MQVWTWISLRVYLLFFYIVFYWNLSSIFQQAGRSPDITIVEGVWRTEVFLLPLILNVGFVLSEGTETPSGRGAPQQAHLYIHLKHLNRLKSETVIFLWLCVWEISSLLCADTSFQSKIAGVSFSVLEVLVPSDQYSRLTCLWAHRRSHAVPPVWL